DANWRAFFDGFAFAANGTSIARPGGRTAGSLKTSQVDSFIFHYRSIGHLQAHLDPLGEPPGPHPRLALGEHGLSDEDLDTVVEPALYLGGASITLRKLIENLEQTYCGQLGVEYTHIQNTETRRWLQARMEPTCNQPNFERAQKIRILRRLLKAELFEKFLHTRFLGQKRFSLEGAETMIPLIDTIVEKCGALDLSEIVMGMAHRGRLTVLASVLRKEFDFIFEEFSENYVPDTVGGDGDVKYHLGYNAILDTASGRKIGFRLAPNPSHLEAVDPVVQGQVRARQRLIGDTERKRVVPLLVHGDAAFAGQGVVAETLNFSQLKGYRTGGTVHLVVNNQIGFTTNPNEARSSRYCTDVAKMIEAPIFHVNSDNPELACMVAELALDYRQKFAADVVIDMVCYRRHGHNEADEPAFTQPLLYQKISRKEATGEIYGRKLIAEGTITEEEREAIRKEYTDALEASFEKAKQKTSKKPDPKARFEGANVKFQPKFHFNPVDTRASREHIETAIRGLTTVPDGFNINNKIKRLLENRTKTLTENHPIDWGFAEALAFGTLMLEGTPVRLSGQDSERGTFSHRHAVLYDYKTNERHVPLLHLAEKQAQFCVYNSSLSEAAILGFDYGYSLDYEDMLCIWEAQFGDFANGAQVVIDQFISSGESKWQRSSDIVLLLPHGHEGQGPEHSSARLERFLQLSAEDNIQVCNLTTSAQYFHALRRQMKRDFKKPLVIMAPKSLLRNPAVASSLDDLTGGSFHEIIDDPAAPKKPARLVLCSGKIYYDLCDYREALKITDASIVRVEQLYPLHTDRLAEIAAAHKKSSLVWCQEESQNNGAWSFIAPRLEEIFGRKPAYAGRDASASPAVGSLAVHKIEQAALLQTAFTL
ncbi:MAG TPA: 2-oxoglutarate dehydrogenase E1 component, partial [Opitutaceae bacterium]|nr:2-oxoglutarate dehydrogenase E1 component [Opitutaceae bacterium]